MNRFFSVGLITVCIVALYFVQPFDLQWLGYQRSSFTNQWWQTLAHMVPHLNYMHLTLNASALLLIYYLFTTAFESPLWLVALLLSAVTSTLGMYWFSPDIDWCVGLSGPLHGLFVYAVIRARAHWLWIAGIALKLFIEQAPWLFGDIDTQFTERLIDGSVVVDAHLWGALGGILVILGRSMASLAAYIEIGRQ